jgi:hypothetical protein
LHVFAPPRKVAVLSELPLETKVARLGRRPLLTTQFDLDAEHVHEALIDVQRFFEP